MPSPTPTPPGTPTQIYVRFGACEDGLISAQIGCDGEENSLPEVRATMAAIANSLAILFAVLPDGTPDHRINNVAAASATRLAEYLAKGIIHA